MPCPSPTRSREESPDYDLLIAVDIGHMELLKDWSEKLRNSRGAKILVDHHPIQEGTPYDQLVVDTTASSAAEIVYGSSRMPASSRTPKASRPCWSRSSSTPSTSPSRGSDTLRAVIELIDPGPASTRPGRSLRSPPDYGEVIAKLKAARRSRIYRASGWVIAVSTVGSFQANVARAFTHLGADVALVVGDFDGELEGSFAPTHRFSSETKIHLGTDVAEVLSKGRGYGGGHPTAASFTCTAERGRSDQGLPRPYGVATSRAAYRNQVTVCSFF